MSTTQTSPQYDIEKSVMSRYNDGAQALQKQLCCPITQYDAQYLKVIPQEIMEKDYGCGDPSQYVSQGQTVVDLGCGAGKICYILAQKVGQNGHVIGVDFNDEMLKLAHKYHRTIAGAIGYDNVRFYKGRIQDLALSLDKVDSYLEVHPVNSVENMLVFEAESDRLRHNEPMIADNSVDVVVSNCVLNLVKPQHKQQLFGEIFRVLNRGGRAVISDIVCDESPSQKILDDPQLWSGCISGAFREDAFLGMFEDAGFHGIEILVRQAEPWQVIDGIKFRSMTVRAYKGKQDPCHERHQAVMYKGPWKQVTDDDGHTLLRGQRIDVCDKTCHILTDPAGPYAGQTVAIEPYNTVPPEHAKPIPCTGSTIRHPRQTKGENYYETPPSHSDCCTPGTSGLC